MTWTCPKCGRPNPRQRASCQWCTPEHTAPNQALVITTKKAKDKGRFIFYRPAWATIANRLKGYGMMIMGIVLIGAVFSLMFPVLIFVMRILLWFFLLGLAFILVGSLLNLGIRLLTAGREKASSA